MMYI